MAKLTRGRADYNPSNAGDASTKLKRFDVIALPTRLDFDDEWNEISTARTPFMLHFGAALNIGETSHAHDFQDYAVSITKTGHHSFRGTLDQKKYLDDTAEIVRNILKAQEESGISDSVWIPFGMGAFIRNLKKIDKTYDDFHNDQNLRNEIACTILSALMASGMTSHLCLPNPDDLDPNPAEAKANFNAFKWATQRLNPKNVSIYINIDACQLAQELANSKGPFKVSLTNAANRAHLGNHYMKESAKTAVDENAIRRMEIAAIGCACANKTGRTLEKAVEIMHSA